MAKVKEVVFIISKTVWGCGCTDGIRLPPLLCTKERKCGVVGCKVDLMLANTLSLTVYGWSQELSAMVS